MKTNSKLKVENFCGVKNQFIITTGKGRYFQSYDSIIAFIPNKGPIELDVVYYNYSNTTSKYLNRFLGNTSKETKSKLIRGEYKLTNLNN